MSVPGARPARAARREEPRDRWAGDRTREPIPLARPVLGRREEERVLAVLRSGRLSLGPEVVAFEQAFARRLGVACASAVSSGTAGLHLALRAVGVGEGDEVITSPFSFVASANAILYERARPVFVDVDPVTLNLDPQATAAAITARTTAVLPVHIFGYPADLPALERLGPALVEDACEALGARHADGVAVGARGHPAVFGFYANKQLTTGEGGMVVSADPALKARVDSERNQGRAPDMGWLDHDRLGFNYRLSDVACAIGLAQLERLDELREARRALAALYTQALADIEGLALPCPDRAGDELREARRALAALYTQALADIEGLALPCPDRAGDERGWFVYVVGVPDGVDRDETIRALREHGIDSKPYLPAIHLLTFYRERFGHRPGEFPHAERAAARSLALPFFVGMTEGQVARVAATLRRVLGR